MDEQTKAAFAAAAECAKQLITLATGLLALEITFAKEVVQQLDMAGRWTIALSWILLLLSVVAGVWTLLALTGSLASTAPLSGKTIFGMNVRIPAMLQIVLFLIGLLSTVGYGILGLAR
jgi:hypothetical protein